MVANNPRAEEAKSLLAKVERIYSTDFPRARNLAEQSQSICRTLNEPLYLARSLDLVANAYQTTGALSAAKELMEESYSLRQMVKDERGIGVSLRNLSDVARLAGEFDEAEDLVSRSMTIFSQLDDLPQLNFSIGRLHAALVYGGKFDEAARLFEGSAPIYHEFGFSKKPVDPTIVSAFGLMHLGRYDEAEERFQQTLPLYPEMAIGYAIKNLGRIALVRGQFDTAETHLLKALALFRKSEAVNGLGQTLGCLGMLALRLGDQAQAQKYIDENLQMAADTLMILPSMTALSSLALLRIEEGEAESAIELYAAASQAGHVANSCWYHDVIGQQVDAAADSLSPAVVKAAQKRGEESGWQSALNTHTVKSASRDITSSR